MGFLNTSYRSLNKYNLRIKITEINACLPPLLKEHVATYTLLNYQHRCNRNSENHPAL